MVSLSNEHAQVSAERSADTDPLDSVVIDLVRELGGRIDEAGVADCVRDIRLDFAEARITQYLPILVRREAKARLLRPRP